MIDKLRKYFAFGEMSLKRVILYLYGLGCLLIIYKAYRWGKSLYLTNFIEKDINYIQNGERWYTSETVNNAPLGILGFFAYFLVFSFIWKLVCELLYIIFERIARK